MQPTRDIKICMCIEEIILYDAYQRAYITYLLSNACVRLKEFLTWWDVKMAFYSILHLAISHGREGLVSDILQLTKQLPPTEPPLVDSRNAPGMVSDLYKIDVKMQRCVL